MIVFANTIVESIRTPMAIAIAAHVTCSKPPK